MGFYNQFQKFIISWRFAVLMLSVLFFFTLLMILVILLPTESGALAAFAEDFKIWCFRYDPATGTMEWSYVVMFMLQPLLIGTVILAVWWNQLRQVFQMNRQGLFPYIGGGFMVVLVAAVIFAVAFPVDSQASQEELPFPAEQLRTEFRAPDFTLTDHRGQTIRLSELRGKVVLVTAVYASCGHTCPLILQQAKRVFARLTEAEKQQLKVLVISLDPENDSPEILQMLATNQQLDAPYIHFLTGDPEPVNRALDNYSISRQKDPETGVISHANLFILVDKAGRVAYRFSLGQQQENWLTTALKLLIHEPVNTSTSTL
ncbi:MAG: redoxin domain-containing protein [Calditrichaeota bacterium]|nr:redoxin domain-containing protein [Calditrichota bacterium]